MLMPFSRRVRLLCAYLGLLTALPSSAATYLVAPPGSALSKSGTTLPRFATIQDAADRLAAGDTVLVASGVFNETVEVTASGRDERRIVVRAADGAKAVITGGIRVTGDYVRIEGLHFDGGASGSTRGGLAKSSVAGGMEAATVVTAAHADVVGNTYTNVKGVAISAGPGTRVADNYLYMCQLGIFAQSGCVVENNEVERLYAWNTSADCDYSRFFGNNIVFRNNHFHGTRMDSEIGSAHVDCFQTYDISGTSSQDCMFEDNVCEDCHQGVMLEGRKFKNTRNLVFRNNIFTDCRTWGIRAHDIDEIIVLNNVFANMRIHGIGLNRGTGHVVRNNIFYNPSSSNASSYFLEGSATGAGSNNLLYNVKNPVSISGNNNIVGQNPLFVDASAEDFHLTQHSPAIDRGVDVGLYLDMEGTARPAGAGFDIGPFEFGSAPRVAAPSIAPAGGTFSSAALVRLGSSLQGVPIHYTLDGSEPTTASSLYTGPFTVDHSLTLKARAFGDSIEPSTIVEAAFVIETDRTAPSVLKTVTPDDTTIMVLFSELVDPASAENTGNYSTGVEGEVRSATLNASGTCVRLSITSIPLNMQRTLAIEGVTDRAPVGNVMAAETLEVTYRPQLLDDFDGNGNVTWQPRSLDRWSVGLDGFDQAYQLGGGFINDGDKPGEYALAGNTAMKAFELSVSVRAQSLASSQDMCLVFGYRDEDNFYYFMGNSTAAYTELFRVQGGIRTSLASINTAFFTDEAYHEARLVVRDDEVVIYRDGIELARVEEEVQDGRVGIGSYNDAVSFDDFLLTSFSVGSVAARLPGSFTRTEPSISIQPLSSGAALVSVTLDRNLPITLEAFTVAGRRVGRKVTGADGRATIEVRDVPADGMCLISVKVGEERHQVLKMINLR